MCELDTYNNESTVPFSFSRRRMLIGAATATMAASLVGCSIKNPATKRASLTGIYSVRDDIKLGQKYHSKMLKQFGGEYVKPTLNRYIDAIGMKLARYAEFSEFTYRFTIVNTPIVNAFATAGGYIYLSRGLLALANSEAEIAGVLAHEIGHVNARHVAERMTATQLSQIALLIGSIGLDIAGVPASGDIMRLSRSIVHMAIQSYSREQEFESDMLGVRYMSRAGYNPDAMVSFLASLGEHSRLEAKILGLPHGRIDQFNIMATHPRTAERVQRAQKAAEIAKPKDPRTGRREYLNQLDGILFGDDPKSQGVIKGRRFVHAGLRVEFTVPEGYILRNSPSAVMAFHSPGNYMIFDIKKLNLGSNSRDYLTRKWAKNFRLLGIEELKINGMSAATAYSDRQSKGGLTRFRMVVMDSGEEKVFRLMYVSKAEHSADYNEAFRRTTYSFRRISLVEAEQVNPLRLLTVRSRTDDTIARLAKTLPYGRFNESWFRLMNAMDEDDPLIDDSRLKVVAD